MTNAETIVRIELSKQVINPLFSDTKEVAIVTKKRNGKLFQETIDLTNELDYMYYRTCKRELALSKGESLLK
jgi:hypothetical protein|tara:strand:+ start:186 stop:401 length:216 start_codon:yes stop_codon:yes gene_type:complete